MTASMRDTVSSMSALLTGVVLCGVSIPGPVAAAQMQNDVRKIGSSAQLAAAHPQSTSDSAASPSVPGGAAPASADSSGQLAEIVVTAEKRREDLLNVPASISAITSSQLGNQHIESVNDIAMAVPGLSFSANSGSNNSVGVGSENISIRGIGAGSGGATVAMYIDDVPITQFIESGTIQSGSFVPMLFDLSRVEVLRGPQGTLYGSSSEGGTIRFITKQPTVTNVEGMVSGNLSKTLDAGANTDDKAILNLPLVPGALALRADADYVKKSGWIDRYQHAVADPTVATSTLLNKDVNGENDWMARVMLKYQPDDTFSITPWIMYQKEHQDDSPSFFLNAGLYNQVKSVAEYGDDIGEIAAVTVDKKFPYTDLTSSTSYFDRHFDRARDGTYFDSDYVVPDILDVDPRTAAERPLADADLAVLPVTAIDIDHIQTYTEELRLASVAPSAGRAPVTWLLGAYVSRDADDRFHDELAPGWGATFQSIYGFGVNNPLLSPLADPTVPNLWQDNFYHLVTRTQAQQVAIFGQLGYDLLRNLTATVGLRYQISNLRFSYHGSGYYDIGISDINDSHARDVAATPKVTLRYALARKANVYISAAKGYRDGGFNNPVSPKSCGQYESELGISGNNTPRSYNPDTVWSYEFGYKALVDDNHLSVNGDVYDIEWNGLQQQVKIPFCGFKFTANVGSARAYGTELEMAYRPAFAAGLLLSLSGSVEHAVITSSSTFTVAKVGERLLYTPEWTGALTASYTRPVSESLSVFVRAQNYWQGKSYGDFLSKQPDYISREYGELNASLGFTTAGGLEVQAFAQNLLDNTTIIREPTVASVTEAYTLPPRILGIQATKTF